MFLRRVKITVFGLDLAQKRQRSWVFRVNFQGGAQLGLGILPALQFLVKDCQIVVHFRPFRAQGFGLKVAVQRGFERPVVDVDIGQIVERVGVRRVQRNGPVQ